MFSSSRRTWLRRQIRATKLCHRKEMIPMTVVKRVFGKPAFEVSEDGKTRQVSPVKVLMSMFHKHDH